MAGNSKGQGGKKKTTKKTSVATKSAANKTPVKATNKARTSATSKKTKKAASFSKNASAKATPKKSTKKVEKKVTKPVEKSNFDEFETLKLAEITKLDSKIILRDVARETPIPKATKTTKKEVKKPEKFSSDIIIPKLPVKEASKITAKEIKEQEIEKAIKNATRLSVTSAKSRRKQGVFSEFGWKRALLAAACVATAVFAIVYFVNITSADVSLRTAAAQSGIDAAYPSYTPRGYDLSDVTSSSGRVSMHFKSAEGEYGITEEISNWDSEALLNNYVKPTYGNDYTIIREQGLTIFMGGNWEAWVNGGVLYKLTVDSGSLTKKQMNSIATSF